MSNLKTDEDDDFITSASPEQNQTKQISLLTLKKKEKTLEHNKPYYFNYMCMRFCFCSSQACIHSS